MDEWKVSVASVSAALLWLTGLCLILVDLATPADLGELGLFAVAVAAVITMRHTYVSLFEMQHKAFEFGRDYERGQMRETGRLRAIP